jgi:hypothetical protein
VLKYRTQTRDAECGRNVPESLLQKKLVALNPESRSIQRCLGIETVTQKTVDELKMCLCLTKASHNTERPDYVAILAEHPGDDCVIRPPSWLHRTINAEARPSVL